MGLRDIWNATGQAHDPPRFKALEELRLPILAPRPAAARQVRPIFFNGSPRRQDGLQVRDDLQQSVKSISYSDYVNDFINNTGFYEGDHYTKQQVEAAYRTSVYLFAALRRVANLFSEVRIVAEVRNQDGTWDRADDTSHLNMIFASAGAQFMRELYLYYAMYGKVIAYKEKTRQARLAYKQGKLITNYLDGGIAGLHIVPNSKWDADEDEYRSEIRGFRLNEPDGLLETGTRDRSEFVYIHDFDFRNRIDAVSMVSLALNNAITNAAIARWASQYFMSGAMPLLVVMPTEDSPGAFTEVDALKYKSLIERIWQGLWGKFSLRAAFMDRKMQIEKVGITADDVKAPELNQDALNAITSVFQIAPDLIVPPSGGTQDRHKWLIRDAYTAAVLPVAWQMVSSINDDFGFDAHSPVRLVVNEDDIQALEADRADNADIEIKVFEAGIQTYGEAQDRLKIKEPIPEIAKWVNVNGKFQSLQRLMADDQLPSDKIVQYAAQSFVDNIVTRAEARKLLYNLDTPPEQDGYYWQVVPQPGSTTPPGGAGEGADLPPPDPSDMPPAPPNGGLPPTTPSKPESSGSAPTAPTKTPGVVQPAKTPAPAPHGSPGAIVPKQPKPAPPGAPAVAQQAIDEDAEDDTVVVEVAEFMPPESRHDLSVSEAPGAGVLLNVTPPAQLQAPATVTEPQPAYVMLACPGDPLIAAVRAQLEPLLQGLTVEWGNPATWHITLAALDDVSDAQLKSIGMVLPGNCPALHLRAANLVDFPPHDGQQVIALAIEADAALTGLQNAAYAACSAQGVAVSPFSAPDAYHPHLTLAYANVGATVPDFTCALIVEPKALRIARADDQIVSDRPVVMPYADADLDVPATGAPFARGDREQLLLDVQRQREQMRTALSAWQSTGVPGAGLRDNVQVAVRTAIALCGTDAPRAWAAILAACDAGQFDDDADLEENPVLIPPAAGADAPLGQRSAEDELKAWERFVTRPHKSIRPFEPHLLPQVVSDQVVAGLAKAANVKARRAVFADARVALAALQPSETNEAMLAAWAERVGGNPALVRLLPDDAA